MILSPLGLNNLDKNEYIKEEFISKRVRFISDFPIILAIILESYGLWSQYSEFYTNGKINEEVVIKKIQDYKNISASGDDILRIVKYDRNIIKQTNKIFWKKLSEDDIKELNINQNIVVATIQR